MKRPAPEEFAVARRWLLAAIWATLITLAPGLALNAAGIETLPPYQAEKKVSGTINSMGDAAMKPLMDAWLAAFHLRQPEVRRGDKWEHKTADLAISALMFELADLAPITRQPLAVEIAPYEHQFHGDMMTSPLLIQVAALSGHPAYIAVNKRPGAPLPQKTKEFLAFILSGDGQRIVAAHDQFSPLTAAEVAVELPKLQGYLATLDPALTSYKPVAQVSGSISSVGSDGMKTLMDHWFREFKKLQPGVVTGARWEHFGTLNGFNALLVDEADLAPMGRELWPQERAAYETLKSQAAPFEIRVARGGFNTPQRTTAQAIFVNQNNPITQITVPQLKAILGAAPEITHWGQLGITGAWTDRRITIYMPPHITPNAMSMQAMVLNEGAWNAAAHEGTIAETAAAIAQDPGAIGFGGFEDGGPGLKTLAVADRNEGPYFDGDASNASSGRYPLTRYMYIRLNRRSDEPLPPQVKEFLRYILSREGQEPVLYSGYFPLSAAQTADELAKLK